MRQPPGALDGLRKRQRAGALQDLADSSGCPYGSAAFMQRLRRAPERNAESRQVQLVNYTPPSIGRITMLHFDRQIWFYAGQCGQEVI